MMPEAGIQKPETRDAGGRLLVKPFIVDVEGSGGGWNVYYAASRGKALSQAWRAYSVAFDHCTFGEFLKYASAYGGVGNPDVYGKKVTVAGEAAYMIRDDGHYVHFARPDSEDVLLSHPLDVTDGWPE